MAKTRKLTAVGSHIYAGGFTIGVMQHFDVQAHFEEWKFGTETVKQNLGLPVFYPKAAWPLKDYEDKVDFAYGNPPCAPWSQANGRGGAAWQSDPRVQYWADVLSLLDSLRPTVWACESVRGIYQRGQAFLAPYIKSAQKKGYRATHVLCNGINHGVPQSRPRYFLVLSRVDIPWIPTGLKKDVSIADVWKGKFKTKTGPAQNNKQLAAIMKKAEPGEDLRRTFNRTTPAENVKSNGRGGIAGRPPFSYKRLRDEGLAHVITGGCNFIHPTEHRFITIEEQAALCGYPRGYKFVGSTNDCYAQTGKAVMPPVGEYLARVVAAGIRKGKKNPVMSEEEVTIGREDIQRRDLSPYGGQMDLWSPPPPPDPKAARAPAVPRSPRKHAWVKGDKLVKAAHCADCLVVKNKTNVENNCAGPAKVAYRGSGYRIRCMLKEGQLGTAQILAIIHKEFPESTAKDSDVYWNKKKLERQGGVP